MNMRILTAALALASGLALVQTGGGAEARATLMCRMQNGGTQPINAQTSAPYMVTVTGGTSSNQNTAQNMARQSWSAAANGAFGGQFASWSNSNRQNMNCWSTKPNFQWLYTCRATAQPCG